MLLHQILMQLATAELQVDMEAARSPMITDCKSCIWSSYYIK